MRPQARGPQPKGPNLRDVQRELLQPHQLMTSFKPVPRRGCNLDKKFTFFYKPYNYAVNTEQHMEFEEP